MLRMALPCALFVLRSLADGQPSFDVVSVKASQRVVGPDYNNRILYSPNGITAENATLQRLIAEANHLQLSQVTGPGWIRQNEFDVQAKTEATVARDQFALMLQSLLRDRFHLKHHRETRNARAYELVIDKSGSKIRPAGESAPARVAGGFHFHGELRDFADILAFQLTIPAGNDPTQPARAGPPVLVLDRTGLSGVYDFTADFRPELGTDMFTQWQRVLPEQLGLRIVSRKDQVEVLVVDAADRVPAPN